MSGIGLPVREWKGQTIPVEMDDNTVMLLDFGEKQSHFHFGLDSRGGHPQKVGRAFAPSQPRLQPPGYRPRPTCRCTLGGSPGDSWPLPTCLRQCFRQDYHVLVK